jgi:peptidyl-prolyl cis-trans isomerase A (cyclophilin A)
MTSKAYLSMTAALLILAMIIPATAQNAKTQPNPVVVLDTTMGAIKVELFPAKAPITAKNFLDYVSLGFYNGTIVHRIDLVIGMGGYTENLQGRPTLAAIKNESKNGLKNLRGTLAMARYDNPDSATSQFFINLKNNSHLDPAGSESGYAVFGKVIGGMDVVDKIAGVKTGSKGQFSNMPLQTILVKSAIVAAK